MDEESEYTVTYKISMGFTKFMDHILHCET